MRIAFLSAVYPPEREPAAIMAGQLVEHWIHEGRQVDVYCPFPNRPEGVVQPGWKRRLRQVDETRNLRLVRCWSWLVGPHRRLYDRLLENITFGLSSAVQAVIHRRPDILVISTWPFFAVGLAILLARLWRVPAVYYIQDLYPEAAVEAGWLRRNHWLTRILTRIDCWCCLSSSRVVLVSETMKQLFSRTRLGVGDKVSVITNWIDAEEIKPAQAANWRREYNISPQTFVAAFAGNLGLLSGADILVHVAKCLRHRPDILLLCVGEGVLKRNMSADAARLGLSNIRFLPFQPRKRVSEMQSAADVMLLTMRPGSGAASVPSKLITYLAAGRPVLCAAPADSECHAIIRRSGAGVNVPAGDAPALANAIVSLAGDRGAAEQMARRARRHFVDYFTAEKSLREFREMLHSLL